MPAQQSPSSQAASGRLRMSRRPFARLLPTTLFAVGALVLASCTTAAPDAGTTASAGAATFNIGIGVDLDTVDPAQQTTTTVQNVVDYGVERLTTIDQQGRTTPGLAQSWDVSTSGLEMTLHLRKGVKFHDGTAFDAQAVKFNLDRIRDPKIKVPIGGAFKVITDVKVVDDSTVLLTLKYPDPTLISNLGITTSGIISPASATKDGNTYENIVKPVGTGPYIFKSFTKGDKAVYERNNDYWGDKPYYSTVVFHIIPEGNSREAALRAGEVQMIMNPPVTDLQALDKDPKINVLKAPSDRAVFVAFNNSKPPFNNVDVRRALNFAVDKQAIAKNVMFGTVDVMDSPLPASLSGYCKAGSYDHDPQKAKELLAKAGVTTLDITFGSPSGRYLQDHQAAQAIAADLKEVGVNAKVSTTDWPSYVAGMVKKDGPYDMHVLGWAPGALDAATQFQMFEKANWPPAGLATAFYTNPTVETLLAKGNQDLDETSRNATYCEAQKAIWDDAPWIFLWSQTLNLAYASDIAGISYVPNEKFDTIHAHPAGS